MIPESFSIKLSIARNGWPTLLLGLAVFLTPLLTLHVPLSLAILLPVLTVFAVLGRIVMGTPRFRFNVMSTTVVVAIIIAAAASAGWSYSADLSWEKLPRTAMIAFLGIGLLAAMSGLERAQTRTISKAFLFGIILTFALLVCERVIGEILIRTDLIEGVVNDFLNKFNRPLSLLAIMLWPAVAILADKRPAYGIAGVVLSLAVFMTFQTGAATAAIAFGALIFVCVYMAPRIMAPLTGALLGISVFLAPTIDHVLPEPKEVFEELNLPRSAYHRLLVWQFTADRIAERPLVGWGFNTSRAIPGGKKNLDVSEVALPLHPHNAALQWRLELGLLGALLGAALFVVATVCAQRYGRSRMAQAAGTATVASAFCVAMLSFGAWQSWWLSGLFVIAGITVLVCRNPDQSADT
jgi:exopolysaccharide production protein ExoQ